MGLIGLLIKIWCITTPFCHRNSSCFWTNNANFYGLWDIDVSLYPWQNLSFDERLIFEMFVHNQQLFNWDRQTDGQRQTPTSRLLDWISPGPIQWKKTIKVGSWQRAGFWQGVELAWEGSDYILTILSQGNNWCILSIPTVHRWWRWWLSLWCAGPPTLSWPLPASSASQRSQLNCLEYIRIWFNIFCSVSLLPLFVNTPTTQSLSSFSLHA